LEKHVLLKKLRDALESLKGRVAGRNKDDVEDAISMVSFLYYAIFIGFVPLSILMPYIKHFSWLLDKETHGLGNKLPTTGKGPRWLPMLTWTDKRIKLKKRKKNKERVGVIWYVLCMRNVKIQLN
jgi:hypothetical protein